MKTHPAKVYEEIGATLCQLQTIEELMSLCLTTLRCEPAMTVAELIALDKTHRKATLGQLIRSMGEAMPGRWGHIFSFNIWRACFCDFMGALSAAARF